MNRTLVAALAVLALPPASYGLTVTLGLQGPGGPADLFVFYPTPPGVVDVSLTVNVQADANLGGVQYAFLARKTGVGDVRNLFRFTHRLDPWYADTRLERGGADANGQKGAFDKTSPSKWNDGDYIAGPGLTAPISMLAADPDTIFKTIGEAKSTTWTPNPARLITHHIRSVPLDAGTYVISLGDKAGLGFKGCNDTSGCVDAISGTAYTVEVFPEPMSALLLVALLPLLRRRFPNRDCQGAAIGQVNVIRCGPLPDGRGSETPGSA